MHLRRHRLGSSPCLEACKMSRKMSLTLVLLLVAISASTAVQTAWPGWGGDISNTRLSNTCVNKALLRTGMTVKWKAATEATAYAAPSVCGGFVYTLDMAGNVYKFQQNTGALMWKQNVKTLVTCTGARSTPVFSAGCAVMYTFTLAGPYGVFLIALKTSDGSLAYAPRLIDNHPLARATQSPTMYGGSIYMGMSSSTENSGLTPSFRGSMFRIRAADGLVLWRSYTTPVTYAGAPIWGSAPVVDPARNQVCVGTGNNYLLPAKVVACVKGRAGNIPAQLACTDKRNYVDALVCFRLDNGLVKWGRPLHGVNVYLSGGGRDYDFAQAPILIGGLLVAASKAGTPFALRAVDGGIAWKNVVRVPIGGPAINDASAMFGSCTNKNIFVMGLFWFSGPNSKRGVVAAFNAATGRQIWVKDFGRASGGVYGPLTCTPTVVFAPVMDAGGSLVAMDIANGAVLGIFNSGASLFCGPTIVGGTMFLGNGYPFAGGSPGNTFYAVNLPVC